MTEFRIKGHALLIFDHIVDSKDKATAIKECETVLKKNFQDHTFEKIGNITIDIINECD